MEQLRRISLFLFSLLALASCSTPEVLDLRYVLDNPTTETLTFSIDDQEYSLPPKQSKRIELTDGTHTLRVGSEKINLEINRILNGGSLINPSNSKYIVFYEFYTGDEEIKESTISRFLQFFQEIEVDGEVLTAPAALIDGYFIEPNGNPHYKYSVDQNFPEEIQSAARGKNAQIVQGKLFRIEDFKPYYLSSGWAESLKED